MRKIITIFPLAAALFAGQAMADQNTISSLQEYCVALSEEQSTAITMAEGQPLIEAIAQLVATQPIQASTITVAAARSNLILADDIVAAAVQAAPGQEQEIRAAIEADKTNTFIKVSECIPSSEGPFFGIMDSETSAEVARVGTANLPASSTPSSGIGNSESSSEAVGIQIASPN